MKTTIKQEDRITNCRLKEQCCDVIYEPGYKLPRSPGGCYIVFCKTEHAPYFFNACKQSYNTNYVLVTHDSDVGITKELFDQAPPNVFKWFAMNVKYKHDQLISIPIGSVGATWIGVDEHATQKHLHDYTLTEETGKPKQHRNLVYINFGIHTNNEHRAPIYNYFKDKQWATVRPCDIPLSEYNNADGFVSISQYYDEVYNHKFVMSPLGNGVDCGRNWQCLYLGTIPIVPRHINIEFYEDLPILIYDNINDLTEEYLNSAYEEITRKKVNLEKSTLSYWKNRFYEEKQLASKK
jgi:hypothetical protein|tara:strand:- start:10593 stop:11474 length:882 start_codon:yes stop_codon:yes gene_type:complete